MQFLSRKINISLSRIKVPFTFDSGLTVPYVTTDTANWLGSFCAPVRSWNGLLLRRPIDMEKRDGIQRGEASLLDLRSYLFSRQCTLLIFLQRPWEVTQRALELLHNCVQELRLLEVNQLLLYPFFHVHIFPA